MGARVAKVDLNPADRGNWRAIMKLETRPQQREFVAPPGWSLAGCLVKRYGEDFEYLPMAICDGERVVGYVTLLANPNSQDDYWVDDILIDAAEQGRGYGRAAMNEVIRMLLRRYQRCHKIQLTCFEANVTAAALYVSLGFRKNGQLNEVSRQPDYELTGTALAKFR
jgi:diamine N-acetyltransferase